MATKKVEKVKSKDELLAGVIKDIEKEYGKGSIMKLGDRAAVDVEPIPSGSLLLDKALGIGGYPKGRIIEIYGPESSGKTTLALHAIAEVDSVAALVPQAELDGEMGEMQVGAQARMMSKAMRKLSGMMNQNDCTAIFINQLRLKVGVMYGNPETTPGGYALKFYSSVRIEIRKSEVIKNGTEIVGNKVNVKIVKNKVAAPFRKCTLEITYGQGLSALSELIDLAVDYDVIKKSGSWYSYQGDKIGQGKEASKEYLKNNEALRSEIEQKVQALIRSSNLSDDIDHDDIQNQEELALNDAIEEDFDNIDLETGEILDD